MSQSPFQIADSLRIGSVDYVSPDEIKVALDIEAPESVALNAGGARPFPRVNGYVVIPVDDGHLVGQIEWLTIERSQFPKRRGLQDFGLIDLPYPLRRMSLNPLGTLRLLASASQAEDAYCFQRGADALPSIGAGVHLPTSAQLKAIVESGENRHVKIGVSPLADNAEVRVNPDRLFGRHLAVLGNTGGGKSCSVAGLIRWSLEQARTGEEKPLNARFIVLDPNGEYARAFADASVNARVVRVKPNDGEFPLRVPVWLWNSAEWCAFTRAGEGAQRPLLRRALREIRAGANVGQPTPAQLTVRRKLSSILVSIRNQVRTGQTYEGWKLGPKLAVMVQDLHAMMALDSVFSTLIGPVTVALEQLLAARRYTRGNGNDGYNDFASAPLEAWCESVDRIVAGLGGVIYEIGPSENTPIPFKADEFVDHLETLAEHETNPHFFDFLIMRIRMMLSDPEMTAIVGDADAPELPGWLAEYVGGGEDDACAIKVIDLSLVPTEIVHIVTAVIARVVFESLQRYRKLSRDGHVLPTVIVMEEAHTFIRRYKDEADHHDAAAVCCQVFEKIAREGRKFGLGLVVSSQRPSELSPTVLSQCNSFLLHRISNDKDQELVHKMVPDNLRGLLRELPSLPSQNAILMGWASELPILVRMNDLPKPHQPKSDDPDFWAVWTGRDPNGDPVTREVDWKAIAEDWQGAATLASEVAEQPRLTPTVDGGGAQVESYDSDDDFPF